jgi:hypothetical protein
VICVAELTVNDVAAVPLNATPVAPVNPVPVIVTDVPTGPLVGENPVTVGADAATVNELALVPVPPAVVTDTVPLVAPVGTVAVTCVAELTVNDVADVPLNFTAVAPVKPVPVIVTDVPTGPLVGENPVTVGGEAVTVNEPPPPPGATYRSDAALCELPLVPVVVPVYWCEPVPTGPAESTVAAFTQAAEAPALMFASARSVKPAGLKLEKLVALSVEVVVRYEKKPTAQALADGFDTGGPATDAPLVRFRAPPDAAIGFAVSTPRHAPVSNNALVLFVHCTVGAVSPLTAIL